MIPICLLAIVIFSVLISNNLHPMLSHQLPKIRHSAVKQIRLQASDQNRTKWLIAIGLTGTLMSYFFTNEAESQEDKGIENEQEDWGAERNLLHKAAETGLIDQFKALLYDKTFGNSDYPRNLQLVHTFVIAYEHNQEKILIEIINHPDFKQILESEDNFVRWALAAVASSGYESCLRALLGSKLVKQLLDYDTAVTVFQSSVLSTKWWIVKIVLDDEHIKNLLTIKDLRSGLRFSLYSPIDYSIYETIEKKIDIKNTE